MTKYITDVMVISSDNSDEENFDEENFNEECLSDTIIS